MLNPVPATIVPQAPAQAMVEYKACMFCGESILVHAIKCKHCGEMLNQGYPPPAQAFPNALQQQSPFAFPAQQAPIVNVPVNIAQHTHVVHQTSVIVHKAPFNHLLHFMLTLFTCGGWFPIWIICWLLH